MRIVKKAVRIKKKEKLEQAIMESRRRSVLLADQLGWAANTVLSPSLFAWRPLHIQQYTHGAYIPDLLEANGKPLVAPVMLIERGNRAREQVRARPVAIGLVGALCRDGGGGVMRVAVAVVMAVCVW